MKFHFKSQFLSKKLQLIFYLHFLNNFFPQNVASLALSIIITLLKRFITELSLIQFLVKNLL